MRKFLLSLPAFALIIFAACFCAYALPEMVMEEQNVPILMYHHILDKGDASVTIAEDLFRQHMDYLDENGWTPVSFDELIACVDCGEKLPEKPCVIVFDDGYTSNYKTAYPILKEHNFKATICVIGSYVGKNTYKDTDKPIIPHFNWEQAREMVDSGLISIQSHTYDLHMHAPFETGGNIHENVLKLENETEADYRKLLLSDYVASVKNIRRALGTEVNVFAYPSGKWDRRSESILRSAGVRVTLTTAVGTNTVRTYDKESLYLMKRYTMNDLIDLPSLEICLSGGVPQFPQP